MDRHFTAAKEIFRIILHIVYFKISQVGRCIKLAFFKRDADFFLRLAFSMTSSQKACYQYNRQKKRLIEEGLGRLGDAQKEAYTTVGGTPFLDGEYTVFGEVESGLDVVEKIQAAATDSSDRPLEDISMKVSVL